MTRDLLVILAAMLADPALLWTFCEAMLTRVRVTRCKRMAMATPPVLASHTLSGKGAVNGVKRVPPEAIQAKARRGLAW